VCCKRTQDNKARVSLTTKIPSFSINMIQDVRVKLNPGSPWQKWHSTRRRLVPPAKPKLKLMEKWNEVLHLEYSFDWC
jgi:hypothetical protein